MIVRPELAELRRDPRPIRDATARLQAERDAWLAKPRVARFHHELGEFGRGAPLTDCRALNHCLGTPEDASALVGGLIQPVARILRDHPWGHVPFRHQSSGGIASLQFLRNGRATLSLVSYAGLPGQAEGAPKSVSFSDGERHEICLAGSGEGRLIEILHERADYANLQFTGISLLRGTRLAFVGPTRTKLIDHVKGRLVMLRLSREATAPLPTREFRIVDGQLLHRASGDRDESRTELVMALLGRMGRADAVDPMLERLAGEASPHLRWQALRHALALDSGRGFGALCRLLDRSDDPLRGPAERLHRQLIATHPLLRGSRDEPCPV